MSDAKKPKITIRFIYNLTDNLPATRVFYSQLLGMQESNYMDEADFGWIVYECDGLQLMFFRGSGNVGDHRPWDYQPGDGDERHQGTRMSFSVHYPWREYRQAVKRLSDSGSRTMTPKPTWRQASYWGWTVKDPQGTTIEIYSDPPQQPAEGVTPAWRD